MKTKDKKTSINEVKPSPEPQNQALPPKPESVPEEQWNLPAGYKPDGSFASLAEVLADPIPTASLEVLNPQERKGLIVERIKQQDYPTKYMLGVGVVNKERAITEVEAQSPAGKVIQESEQRVIQMMQVAAKSI